MTGYLSSHQLTGVYGVGSWSSQRGLSRVLTQCDNNCRGLMANPPQLSSTNLSRVCAMLGRHVSPVLAYADKCER